MTQLSRYSLLFSDLWSSINYFLVLKTFVPLLTDHLIAYVKKLAMDGGSSRTFSNEDRRKLWIRRDRAYLQETCRINFTSYDNRRSQDCLKVKRQSNVMVVSQDDDADEHPYWHARVIGIFQVEVIHHFPGLETPMNEPKSVDVIWVRWYGRDLDYRSGWNARRLPRIGYDPEVPFGFLHPTQILRAAHIIPAFSHGRTRDLLGPSVCRLKKENDEDWMYYYVNM